MNRTNFINMAAIAFLAVGLLLLVNKSEEKLSSNVPTDVTPIMEKFTSPETGESISVSFTDKTAVLENSDLTSTELLQVEAASGARYENTETGTVLLNKGSEITVYKNNEVVFTGQTKSTLGNPDPNQDSSDFSTSTLLSHTWVWKETLMNDGTVISPKQAGVFTLTFDDQGRVSGQTDCNGFGGAYTVTDSVLTTGEFMMTMMYCEGSQEMEFQKMLSEPVTYMLTETGDLVMMLPFDSGSVIFEPKR
jgi:heat shock protein HslJ